MVRTKCHDQVDSWQKSVDKETAVQSRRNAVKLLAAVLGWPGRKALHAFG
jgi:uncharacterized protein (DUF2267 family)